MAPAAGRLGSERGSKLARTDSTALVAPACLALGGVVGALASTLIFGDSTDARAAAVDAPAATAPGVDPAVETDLIAAIPGGAPVATEIEADTAANTSTRTSIETLDEETDEEAGPTVEELGSGDPLIAELTALLRSGRIEQVLAQDRGQLINKLIDLHLDLNDPAGALNLLQRIETSPGNWRMVAMQLRRSGMAAEANEAMAQAIRLGFDGVVSNTGMPTNFWERYQRFQSDPDEWLNDLLEHAPDLAADLLQQRANATELNSSQQLALIRSLTSAGRSEAALAEIESLLNEGAISVGVLRALRELDPERAQTELETMMASNPSSEIELEYFRLLSSEGRVDEAMAMIAEGSAGGEVPVHLLREAMRNLDPEAIRSTVDEWAASNPNNSAVQVEAAQFYTRSEDYVAAADAYLNVFEVAASGQGDNVPRIPDAVAQAAPAAFQASLDRMTSHAGTDDEYWGDIGDAYWRIGAHQAAEDCWRRASEIDPGDGEWTGNLSALANGNDPL